MLKYGIMMELPQGKIPGYYAQIIKSLAGKAQIFDREKELFIVENEGHCRAVEEVLKKFGVSYEILKLLHLPESAVRFPAFDDYGFTSPLGNHYLYAHLVSVFRFGEPDRHSEREQALLQMEEHLLARFMQNGTELFVTDSQFRELMQKIAGAYGCSIRFEEM